MEFGHSFLGVQWADDRPSKIRPKLLKRTLAHQKAPKPQHRDHPQPLIGALPSLDCPWSSSSKHHSPLFCLTDFLLGPKAWLFHGPAIRQWARTGHSPVECCFAPLDGIITFSRSVSREISGDFLAVCAWFYGRFLWGWGAHDRWYRRLIGGGFRFVSSWGWQVYGNGWYLKFQVSCVLGVRGLFWG